LFAVKLGVCIVVAETLLAFNWPPTVVLPVIVYEPLRVLLLTQTLLPLYAEYVNKSPYVTPVILTSCNSSNSYPFWIWYSIYPLVGEVLTTLPI